MKSLEKQFKRYLKRKFKINLSLLVTFLITGQLGYSLEISGDWVNDEIINETVYISTQGINITNNGIISSKNFSNSNILSGNGILNFNNEEEDIKNNENFINTINNYGTISGYNDSQGNSTLSGNGIVNSGHNSSIGDIFNLGTISGYNDSQENSILSGNGIVNSGHNSSIGDIFNLGTISGYNDSQENSSLSGNGIVNSGHNSSIGDIFNHGIISGYNNSQDNKSYSNGSGNGIVNSGDNSSIGDIFNLGTISGYNDSQENSILSGNGILNFGMSSFSIGDIFNHGIISGYNNSQADSAFSGNAIINVSTDYLSNKTISINNILNSGFINALSNSNSTNSGNSIANLNLTDIYIYDSYIDIINYNNFTDIVFNTGIINSFSNSSNKNSGNSIASSNLIKIYNLNNSNYEINTLNAESSIGNINNTGIISSFTNSNNENSGNAIVSSNLIEISRGYYDYKLNNINIRSSIGDITNTGIISASSNFNNSTSGNAISSFSLINTDYHINIDKNIYSSIGNIKNTGIISAFSNSDSEISNSGNAIVSYTSGSRDIKRSSIGKIDNNGLISAYSKSNTSGFAIISNANANGNTNALSSIDNINNTGLIKGTSFPIFIDEENSNKDAILNNYGILAGENFTFGFAENKFNKYGLEIKLGLDKNKENINSLLIKNGSGGKVTLANGDEKIVVNGTENGNISNSSQEIQNDSYILASNLLNNKDLIINGAGINTGALVIDKNTNIDDSIINGYETAVYLKGDNNLQATNTAFNGGGLKNDTAVIVGDNDNNTLSILGNSVINGEVNLGNGNDNLSIATSTQINGDLIGGIGNDTLNLTNSNIPLNIYNNISEFENLNINGDTTLFETSKITGAENINLASGILTLRIDPTKKDSNGKVIGHSLYENSGIINSSGGKLNLGLNGLGENTIISMGETSINPSLDTNYDNTDNLVVTDSIVLDATLVDGSNGKDIKISVIDRLPIDPLTMGPELYDHLNKSYKSIISSGELGKLANTTFVDRIPKALLAKATTTPIKTYDDAMAGLLGILDQISTNNPYAYTLKSGRDSLKLFEDNMSYLTIKPNNNEWIVQGKAIYTGVKVDNEASGKGHYGFDTGHRNYKTTTNTVGGLATFEYGLSDKSSLGLVFGGNNQDVSFRGSNSIDGNSLYVGSFIKTEKNQFKFMTGLGYQYTSNDVDRSVSNQYDSFKTDEKYDVNSLNAFIEGKYSINVDNQWIMEPKVKLSYYFVNQDKVDEGYSDDQLSIGVDKFATNTGDIEVGFDLKKEVLYSRGKLNNILSFGVINTIGSKDEDLKAHIIGKDVNGSKFDIQGVKLPTTSGKVAYNMEFEQPNGMIYSAGVDFEFAKDNNRNINITTGIGYKF